MSTFDEQGSTTTTEHPAKKLAAKAIELSKAHPFPAAAVGAFVAFGIFAFFVALFGPGTPAPAAPAIAVPSTPPATVAPPAAAAPPPAAAIGASTPSAPAAPVGPVVLPASLPLDTAVERGAVAAVDVDTDPNDVDRVSSWVPVGEQNLAETDAIASLNFAGMAERFASVWPGRGSARVHISGLAKVETAGPAVVILTVKDRGECNAEFGPTGNNIASAGQRHSNSTQDVAPAALNLEPGFYQVRLSCAVQFWRNNRNGSATLSIRGDSGQAKVIELYQPSEAPSNQETAHIDASEVTP